VKDEGDDLGAMMGKPSPNPISKSGKARKSGGRALNLQSEYIRKMITQYVMFLNFPMPVQGVFDRDPDAEDAQPHIVHCHQKVPGKPFHYGIWDKVKDPEQLPHGIVAMVEQMVAYVKVHSLCQGQFIQVVPHPTNLFYRMQKTSLASVHTLAVFVLC
jgi:hypothetical protein